MLAKVNHLESQVRAAAERGVLEALDGSCRTPIAAHAVLDGAQIHLRGEALTPDGAKRWDAETRITLPELDPEAAAALGRELGAEIKRAGGETLARVVAETG